MGERPRGGSSSTRRLLGALVWLPLALACGADAAHGPAEPPPPPVADPRGAKGLLRISVYGAEAPAAAPSPAVQRTRFVRDLTYTGMEDNDLRGFPDGHVKYRWNQVRQAHVRVGRRHTQSRLGEYELFRTLQFWDGIDLPEAARVRRARLVLTVVTGPRRPLSLSLYEVKRPWNPGGGGVAGNDHSEPAEGEVWWNEPAHGREAWGLPGAGFASDDDPAADVAATVLADARWEPGQEELAFESPELAVYVERQVRAGRPVLLLVKLSNPFEDQSDTLLWMWSANADGAHDPRRRPRLLLDWDSPKEIRREERHVHLEYDRALLLKDLEVPPGGRLAARFEPEPEYDPAWLEVREARPGAPWQPLQRPLAALRGPLEIRVRAVLDPLVRGDAFHDEIGDTWVTGGDPEDLHPRWTFVAPSGTVHRAFATYAGDFRWAVEFRPQELGRWSYVIEHELDRAHPYRSPVAFFDVVAGERRDIHRQLKDLVKRIRAFDPKSQGDPVDHFGSEFWTLERALMQLETPDSFRNGSHRESQRLLTRVRKELARGSRRHARLQTGPASPAP